jgi:Na+/proline symporter
MSWVDWLIVIIPVTFVLGIGFYSRKYIRSVADFLAAGRVCGRYVICVGDLANALSIIGLVAYVEMHYKTGFALGFWEQITGPLGIFLALSGFCIYRFRETKALSLGQFLEMRYNRSLRIFAAALRSISEMLANMIMPAIAARFFIYFLDLPHTLYIGGMAIPTFMIIIIISLTMAIGLICIGGALAIIITDSIQGMIFFQLIVTFVIFILCKFSWSNEIIPVMMDRVQGESFLNPYDLSELRDFNLFMIFVVVFSTIMHRVSWHGAGSSGAAKNPHEQKMAGVLGAWRVSVTIIFCVLISVTIITLLNHRNWAQEAKNIRDSISSHISQELIVDDTRRKEFNARISAIPAQYHQIGVDKPLSQKVNLDTPVLKTAHKTLREFNGEAEGNAKFQQYRTLFHQMMLGQSMRRMLPPVMLGLFCLLMILAMISTDDSRIYSATVTLTQDVIMPIRGKRFTPKQHVRVLRIVAICIGFFFFCGSYFMAQLDYIQLFITMMCSIWLGGCGPMMIFGLYSRFGTTAGAFTSLISGMVMAAGGILMQRNWADVVYPWLDQVNLIEPVGNFLSTVSSPFNPYILWEMNPVKFPINGYELYFITMLTTLFLYIIVSYLTMKEPFNLDRMLHRGKYNLDHDMKEDFNWSLHTVFRKLLGITKEYTAGDKVIVWSLFIYSIVWGFVITFVGVIIWNAFTPWPIQWWGKYFFAVYLVVPGIMVAISAAWFSIGGVIDLRRMFHDLKARVDNPLDDGWVEGHVSLADKAEFEHLERDDPKDNPE